MADNSYLQQVVNALKSIPLQEAMPFGAGATPEGSPTALSNMVSGAASLPQRAIEGSAQALPYLGTGKDTQDIGPATNAALLTLGAGMPAAEEGALGMAGGRIKYFGAKEPVRGAGGKFITPPDPYQGIPNPFNPENLQTKTPVTRGKITTAAPPNPFNPEGAVLSPEKFRQNGKFTTQADYFRNRVPSPEELTAPPTNEMYGAGNVPGPVQSNVQTDTLNVNPNDVSDWKSRLPNSFGLQTPDDLNLMIKALLKKK